MTEIALKAQMENSSYSIGSNNTPWVITRGGVSNSSGRFATQCFEWFRRREAYSV